MLLIGCSVPRDAATPEQLAQCLDDKGWVMYGSFTCSACRAQRKAFGDAFALIKEIECNPTAKNSQAERCLEKKIRKMPTWIREQDGAELGRLEGYQLLEDLAAGASCSAPGIEQPPR
jgi:hypothetical protein